MPTRQEVYAAIDTERQYQDTLPSDRTDGREHTVGDFLTMLAVYLQAAQFNWTMHAGDAASLHSIRKLAGICVHCMEKHGAPVRE